MLHRVTTDLPPPSGAPQPAPTPQPTGAAAFPPPLEVPVPGPSQLGTNNLAIAALVCGLLGFFTPAAVVAIVLGIIGLRQMKARFQTGRALAITGMVAAAIWIGLLGPAFVTGFRDGIDGIGTPRDASGTLKAPSRVTAYDLAVGDCLDLPDEGQVRDVTVRPCAQAHEGEVALRVELPDGPFPGDEDAAAQAEQLCGERLAPMVPDAVADDVDLFLIYPNSVVMWETHRTVTCVLVPAAGGTTTGSYLT